MTKKDYNQFANLFSNQFPVKSDLETPEAFQMRMRQFEQILVGVINIFKNDNQRFNTQRFKLAIYKNRF